METERLKLSDVTICAADSAYVDLTARALRISMAQCDFADAILFSDVRVDGPFRWVRIDPLKSIEAYSDFCLRRLADHISTDFVLIVQWDGYVVNPPAWANAFRKYDYIGAAWPHLPDNLAVGNGGFSLRSKRLLKAVQKLAWPVGQWEDQVICRIFRSSLEREAGIRFAPVKIADRFSHELRSVEKTPFGFHGPNNLWRYVEDDELVTVVEMMDVAKVDPNAILLLILGCMKSGRQRSARHLYNRFAPTRPPLVMRRVLTEWYGPVVADQEMAALEALRR